ncbi:IS110 family transposase [Solirubrobacter deserti]|uniref:IS110 family transposase n=1 Tax=Solirubrobacter deserti TaxID=2282478 RepID=A0ABT4RTG1_9ACTN|nr:IS110 family transposase [Solirubrobacter deserti]MDA0141869.1 IS110 family transposase [Solirubrobacter deserti]
MEIRLLADHRNDLVAERTRIVNRLRWHLVDLCPQLEAQVPARCLDHPVWLERSLASCNGCLPAKHEYGSRANSPSRSGNSRAKPTTSKPNCAPWSAPIALACSLSSAAAR